MANKSKRNLVCMVCYLTPQLKAHIVSLSKMLHISRSKVMNLLMTDNKYGISDRQYLHLCSMYGKLISVMSGVSLILNADYYDNNSNQTTVADIKSLKLIVDKLYKSQYDTFNYKVRNRKKHTKSNSKEVK